LFFPLVLVLWHGLNHWKKYRLAQIAVAVMSLWFYGYYNYRYVLLLLGSVTVNWLASRYMKTKELASAGRMAQIGQLSAEQGRKEKKKAEKARLGREKKWIGVIGILFNVGLLFYFKYYDFFVSSVNQAFGTDWVIRNIALPLGISFYTFQQISFVADRMTGEAEHYSYLDYLSYVVYFPQLIAGPIVTHDTLVPQFADEERRHWDWDNFLVGIRIFVLGLAKKVLLADQFGQIVDHAYSGIDSLDTLTAWLAVLCYAFQIYFDFSGYSDMAIGLGKMMNLDLPINFNEPYKSKSVGEYWNRWHITLYQFLNKYIFNTLAMWLWRRSDFLPKNLRKKYQKIPATIAVLATFFISGVWHGAEWSFFLFGIAHGIAVASESYIPYEKLPGKLRCVMTFVFVELALVLFRSDTIAMAGQMYAKLFTLSDNHYILTLPGWLNNFMFQTLHQQLFDHFMFKAYTYTYQAVLVIYLLIAIVICAKREAVAHVQNTKPTVVGMWGLAFLFVLSILTFSGVTEFLYFNF
jgi:D-alanyl-lipoteichoic acid acyltransferase DltB (MBOAT superfamily)